MNLVLSWHQVRAQHEAGPAADAIREIERRAAMLVLEGEIVGDQPLLALYRAALDAYVEAATHVRVSTERMPYYVSPDLCLAPWDQACSTGKVLVSRKNYSPHADWNFGAASAHDPPNGALLLYHLHHSDPQEALRVLTSIQHATEALQAQRTGH